MHFTLIPIEAQPALIVARPSPPYPDEETDIGLDSFPLYPPVRSVTDCGHGGATHVAFARGVASRQKSPVYCSTVRAVPFASVASELNACAPVTYVADPIGP